MTTLDPGGAKGVLLKSNFPKRYAYADKFGFTVDGHGKFKVRKACGRRGSHSIIGKSGRRVDDPALNWFSNVRIALSAKFALCLWGGTIW